MVGAVVSLGAAVLALLGMFQDLLITRNVAGDDEFRYAITSWGARIETNGVAEPAPQGMPLNGLPLTVAVAVLLGAAVLGMVSANRPGARWGQATNLTSVIAATFLAGTVATIGVQELWWLDVFRAEVGAGGDDTSSVTLGPGYWTLVVGVALAIFAAVLAWRQSRREPLRVEPDTPRLGIPVVVRRLPDEPPAE